MFRTDLALEVREAAGEIPGVIMEETYYGRTRAVRIDVIDDEGAKAIKRKKGRYVTVEVPPFSDEGGLDPDTVAAMKTELSAMLPPEGPVLVVGLGNSGITPDAVGPKIAAGILATRHIDGELAASLGFEHLRPVAAVAPGVLGQTGIETAEIIAGIAERIKPAAVIVADALAARKLSRLGRTIQINDTGIHPGSGVGNNRREISRDTLGIPVIAMGVPTVVDAATLVRDLTGREPEEIPEFDAEGARMIVTPREIDLLIERAAALIAHGLNVTLQPHVDEEELLAVMA